MPSASALRLQIESALAQRIPSALTPALKTLRPVAATGIEALDSLLAGGLPIGAVTELVGPECSGRTTVAVSFLARVARSKVCAWIDVSNSFDPLAAAAAGLDLQRLLWVRCGATEAVSRRSSQHFCLPEKHLLPPSSKKGLHGGGLGSHPRSEVKGLSNAVGSLLHSEDVAPRCAEPQRRDRPGTKSFAANYSNSVAADTLPLPLKPWSCIEQALRTADLLLQAGGFSAIVLDMAGLAPEFVSRVPPATWHRYRLAAARTQSSILLLTQHSCAKSSAELLLQLDPPDPLRVEETVFAGMKVHVSISRHRFPEAASNVVPLKKPPQHANTASWCSRAAWAGKR